MPSPADSETPPRSPMDTLIEMGFANRDKNRQLLYKYNNDVNQCVQELLAEDIENWHLTRHWFQDAFPHTINLKTNFLFLFQLSVTYVCKCL